MLQETISRLEGVDDLEKNWLSATKDRRIVGAACYDVKSIKLNRINVW